MNDKPYALTTLEKHSKLRIERIRYLPDADEKVIETIDRGVLLLMAFWSGTSYKSFTKLTEVVSSLDSDGVIEFVVVDIDGSERLAALGEFLGKVHGNGEMAWVRSGSIIATSGTGLNVECIKPNTISLLSMP